ncbi:hypothetical protein DPMN_083989 [Dreissena polymorpha]|uniref:Uncharacterized protein n=1 Tax=Dreissena polymorpha TaxID=45954 RepID=A0A9D3YDJ2_DREPO|nr:hypothetical protein DPMN_083989 [Dreissena polymorpha]
MKEAKKELLDVECITIDKESSAVLNRLIEYCSDLFTYPLQPDPSLLQSDHSAEEDAECPSILKA